MMCINFPQVDFPQGDFFSIYIPAQEKNMYQSSRANMEGQWTKARCLVIHLFDEISGGVLVFMFTDSRWPMCL